MPSGGGGGGGAGGDLLGRRGEDPRDPGADGVEAAGLAGPAREDDPTQQRLHLLPGAGVDAGPPHARAPAPPPGEDQSRPFHEAGLLQAQEGAGGRGRAHSGGAGDGAGRSDTEGAQS